eukprot:8784819-Pyramimonas_sp.AAC.1
MWSSSLYLGPRLLGSSLFPRPAWAQSFLQWGGATSLSHAWKIRLMLILHVVACIATEHKGRACRPATGVENRY